MIEIRVMHQRLRKKEGCCCAENHDLPHGCRTPLNDPKHAAALSRVTQHVVPRSGVKHPPEINEHSQLGTLCVCLSFAGFVRAYNGNSLLISPGCSLSVS